jgi:hypothetical protein
VDRLANAAIASIIGSERRVRGGQAPVELSQQVVHGTSFFRIVETNIYCAEETRASVSAIWR